MPLVLWFAFAALVFGLWKLVHSRTEKMSTAVGVGILRYLSTTEPDPIRSRDWLSLYMLPPTLQQLCSLPLVPALFKRVAKRVSHDTYHFMLTRTVMFDSHFERILTECDREQSSQLPASQPVAQVVIMGAGLDTRCYRFRDLLLAHNTRAFEVDLPRTQQVKKQRLVEAALHLAKDPSKKPLDTSHVQFIETDFNLGDLPKLLVDNGFQQKRKTLFVVEGVLGYLTPEVVDNTLRMLQGLGGPGSYFFCTIRLAPAPLANLQRTDPASFRALLRAPHGQEELERMGLSARLARRFRQMEERGEPWLSSVADTGPSALSEYFAQFGMRVIESLDPKEAYIRYCNTDVLSRPDQRMNETCIGMRSVVCVFE